MESDIQSVISANRRPPDRSVPELDVDEVLAPPPTDSPRQRQPPGQASSTSHTHPPSRRGTRTVHFNDHSSQSASTAFLDSTQDNMSYPQPDFDRRFPSQRRSYKVSWQPTRSPAPRPNPPPRNLLSESSNLKLHQGKQL
ncbi:hypothetical protein LX32DRAFT_646756 [Colletotrichum zoysiae]|uniref:Uncharacterized protein n=1 Tax=Colletotrichum zoysiae TaxID=1216348 RepID=A0AAD9H416_9PEZI|nr:hypothetical protein LX32DRAFT_646756 [Colletotrichum zoysiae]